MNDYIMINWYKTKLPDNITCRASHDNSSLSTFNYLTGKSGGVVRIINRKTAERALLKDLTGRVVDIAFAYTDDVILAAVDEIGNLLVHSIKEGDDKKIQYP